MTDTAATYTLAAEDRATIETPCAEMIIASQTYLDKDIVYAKSDAQDYTVLISQPLRINGHRVRIVNDGHHRLAAAALDNAPINWVVDPIIIDPDDIGAVLETYKIDAPWYDITTGEEIAW